MISKIKAYKINCRRGFLGREHYSKVDITSQLEMPIYDTAQRDGVLDTTRISLINTSKTPLKPLTRVIIELYDSENNNEVAEKLFRVVDNDNVENIVKGSVPLYRHSLSLIEITKILERRPVDNMTFTNYLKNSFTTIAPIEASFSVKATHSVDLAGAEYIGNTRLVGPYHILGQNDTISTDFKLDIRYLTYGYFLWWVIKENRTPCPLTEFYVVLPNGERQTLTTSSGFTFTSPGSYIFTQVYHDNNDDIRDNAMDGEGGGMYIPAERRVTVVATWTIKCVNEISETPYLYNMKEVVERVLKCHKALRKDVNIAEFVLDYDTGERLAKISAPEFALTEGTLFEALSTIGGHIHAIPRLIPVETERDTMVNGKPTLIKDDYSRWDTISFDFLDEGTETKVQKYSIIDLENPLEEYATSFVSNIQNATITNYSGKSTNIEPIRNGFLSARTESETFEISDDNSVFKTRSAIKKIVKAIALFNGRTLDITQRIVELSEYQLKSSYDETDTRDMKSYYLYYKQGEKNIKGLNFTHDMPNAEMAIKEAVKNVVASIIGGNACNIKDIALNIEYVPWSNFKAKQYRVHQDYEGANSSLYYNQQANEVDIDAYGENMHYALVRTGNVKISKTNYNNLLKNIPRCGDYFVEEGNKHIAFQVNREISYGSPIKTTIAWSKDYNELYSQIAVKKAIRQFEISERECSERNIDIQEFCVVDTDYDLETLVEKPLEELSEEDYHTLQTQLWGGFGHPNNMSAICEHLNGNNEGRLATAVLCKATFLNEKYQLQDVKFVCPASFHALGRSVVCYFSMEDNYSAGTFIDTKITQTERIDIAEYEWFMRPKGSYAVENYIPYCNGHGRTNYLGFVFLDKIDTEDSINWWSQADSYLFYKTNSDDHDLSFSKTRHSVFMGYGSDANSGGIILEKDSREKISVTCQLNFVTFNKDVEIYKAMVDTMPYLTDRKTVFKEVLFKKRQYKTSEFIEGDYIDLGQISVSETGYGLATLKVASKQTSEEGEGYGIITEEGRLCVYVHKKINKGTVPPIYFMFRNNI